MLYYFMSTIVPLQITVQTEDRANTNKHKNTNRNWNNFRIASSIATVSPNPNISKNILAMK